jgi:hypothetical protein
VTFDSYAVLPRPRNARLRLGHYSFDADYGARLPFSSLPSPTFTIFAPAQNPTSFIGCAADPEMHRHHHARNAVADDYYKESSGSGSSRAPSPMEKALPRRKHNFVREQTDDDDDEHDADYLVHGI